MTEVIQPTEVKNGQVWKQLEFPHFQIIVLMLTHEDDVLKFCKAGFCEGHRTPLVMTNDKGRCDFTGEELYAHLLQKNYTYVGNGCIVTYGGGT